MLVLIHPWVLQCPWIFLFALRGCSNNLHFRGLSSLFIPLNSLQGHQDANYARQAHRKEATTVDGVSNPPARTVAIPWAGLLLAICLAFPGGTWVWISGLFVISVSHFIISRAKWTAAKANAMRLHCELCDMVYFSFYLEASAPGISWLC